MRAGRVPSDALVQFEAVTGGAFVRAGDLEMYRSLRNDAAIEWQGRFFAGPPPVLTALLVGFQVRVWWMARLPDIQSMLVARFTNWAPPALEDGEVWRLVSMGLLHTETEHLVLNMMWLAYTGWNIERALGRWNLLTLYFGAVLGGALLSMFGSPETQSLGASGGVFGLVAASVTFGFARPDLLPRRGRRLFGAAMLPYLVLMFWSGLMNEHTDNWSHLGGLLVGGFLALILDPEPLQRRPGWNWRVRGTVLALAVLGLLTPLFLGPRLEPIGDSDLLRAKLARRRGSSTPPPTVDSEPYKALTWSAPTGWKPGMDVARGTAFTSPVGGGRLRAWGVRAGSSERLITPEELGQAWIEDLREEWPDAVVGPLRVVDLAGHPGIAVEATVGEAADNVVVEWRGTSRGSWTLEEVWQVDEARQARLAPLLTRLRSSVEWGDPAELRDARVDHDHLPDSPKTRAKLARALARAGELDEAFALHEGLVTQEPTEPDRWLDALASVEVALPRIDDADRWWSRALEVAPAPKVVVEVSRGLQEAGREDEAIGLLDIAWIGAPGDRQLRRARRRALLSTELDAATGEPWDLLNDPVTGTPRPLEDVQERRRWALTLGDAARAGAVHADELARTSAAAAAAIRSGEPDGVVPLLILREGHLPQWTEDIAEALASDVERAVSGRPPAWMPQLVVDAIGSRAEYAEVVRQPR